MKLIKWHILYWFAFFWASFTIDYFSNPANTTITKQLIFFVTQNLFLTYGFLFVIVKFKKNPPKALLISIARIVLLIAAFIAIRYLVRYHVLATYFDAAYGDYELRYWFPTCFTWIINCFTYAFGYYYLTSALTKNKKLLRAQEEQARAEQTRLALENARLRAQINPHFLFNTLGLFHQQVRTILPETAKGILALSEIMSSTLREPDASGLIPLEQEIDSIRNLLLIYQLRHGDRAHIRFTERNACNNGHILPHTLLTLVENGLKHGKIHEAEHPLLIDLNADEQELCCCVRNKKSRGGKDPSHGIGISFLRNQLAFVYKDRFSLDIYDEPEQYSITLRITSEKLHPARMHSTDPAIMSPSKG